MIRAYRVFSLLRPSRPRHPIAQAVLALFAICAFVMLLVFGIAAAAVVMVGGTLLRAFGPGRPIGAASHAHLRAQTDAQTGPPASSSDIIDGEFRVVDKSVGHGTR